MTIFSAPNYCGVYTNKGAIAKLENDDIKVIQFTFAPKKELLLQLGDAFTWTIPILSKNLMDFFIEFLSFTNDAIFDKRLTHEYSILDDTVLDALQIDDTKK